MTETENGLDKDVGTEVEKKPGVANGGKDVKPDLKDAAKRNYEDSDDDDESPLCKCITEKLFFSFAFVVKSNLFCKFLI